MEPLPADIQVYELHDDASLDSSLLTDDEHARRASFENEARRRLFTLGRVALRTHLAERLGLPPRDIPVRVHESGRLLLDGPHSDLQISLAHSGSRAVAVSASRPVGVDLEVMKPRQSSLLRYITHDAEQPILPALGASEMVQLYTVWTLKEAVLKGIGTGLRTGPRTLRITPLEPGQATVLDTDDQAWQARYRVDDTYATAIAWR